MKLSRTLLVITLFGLIQACSSTSETKNSAATDSLSESLSEEIETSLAPTFIMRGTLVVGHETRSFVPCGSNQQYWVNMQAESLEEVLALSNETYQPMYAELIGHLEKTSDKGFDSDFVARFQVSGINFVTTENVQRCDQAYRPTKAFGNEPFWGLEFSDDKTRFQQFGADERGLSLSSTRLTPNERKYHFGQGQLTIEKSLCNDSMSDSLYGWSATFEDDEAEKNGCAMLSNKDATMHWSGQYVASSTQTAGFNVELNLSQDHTATTTYSYAVGLPTRESGFWQQLNEKQVQVVMTQHQGQRLIAERIFTLEGKHIISEYEKVNGKLFPIANGGLLLYKSEQ